MPVEKRIPETVRDIASTWGGRDENVHRIRAWFTSDEHIRSYIAEAFGSEDAIHNYVEWDTEDIYDIADIDLIADRGAALAFPIVYGVAPDFPEVAGWAGFASSRLAQTPRGNYEEFERFQSSEDIRKALSSGVPLSYFKALDPPLYQYIPVDRVIEAYESGAVPEYLRLIIYST